MDTLHPEFGSGTTSRDQLLAELTEQITQYNAQLAELTAQITSQAQKLVAMSQEVQDAKKKINEKEREVEDKERQIRRLTKTVEEKDVQLSVFARMAQGNNSLYPSWSQSQALDGVGTSGGGDGENVSNEVSTLREKVERLEGLVTQVSGT